MFYAHFVLSKKGPLAKIWLAAHWDKKLTKAHVFETNIDSSVEAILKPKVKMALRTSGHLLLGVVRIYSRKAKYLLADCNEAFVKIKMAFRPGVVDLPEENREASVAAITLQENFHDFDTTLADLNEINVQAQFSVNQSRPEEITMREDYGNITLIGDDGFGWDSVYEEKDFGGEIDDEEIYFIIFGVRANGKKITIDLAAIIALVDRTLAKHYQDQLCKQQSSDKLQNNAATTKLDHNDSGIGLDDDPGHYVYHDSDEDADSGVEFWSPDPEENSCETTTPVTSPPATTPASMKLGDVGFDDREILRDATNLEESLFKSPDITSPRAPEEIKNIDEPEKPLDVDMTEPVTNELDEPSFMDAPVDDDDDDNDDFGGEIGQEFLDDTFMEPGGLFEDAPVADVGMEPEEPVTETEKPEEPKPAAQPSEAEAAPTTEPETPAPEVTGEINETTGTSGEQTTLVHNEDEAFALEPLDVTNIPGQERKGKRKRKLIVDEQKGIPSETMKLQLADTADIITTLDLAPPTKKLMHWKETGGVEKLFALPGRPIISKLTWRLFGRNLITKPMNEEEEEEHEGEKIELESPELPRDEDHHQLPSHLHPHQNLHLPFSAGTPQMQQTPLSLHHQNAQLNHLPQPQMTPQQLQASLLPPKKGRGKLAAQQQQQQQPPLVPVTPAPSAPPPAPTPTPAAPIPENAFPSSEELFPSESIRPPVQDNTTIVEEPSIVSTDTSSLQQPRSPDKTLDKTLDKSQPERPQPPTNDPSNASELFGSTFNETMADMPADADPVYPKDLDDEPPSIAPLSVPPPSCEPASVAPASVPPPPCQLTFEDIESGDVDGVIDSGLDDADQEKQWNKRSLQMQHSLDIAFRYNEKLSFKELIRKHNRKQVASRFYTLLVLKKHQSINVEQNEPFGDIFLTKGPRFGMVV